MPILFLATAGVGGVLTRYGTQVAFSKYFGGYSPLSTFFINVLGAFLIGLLYAQGDKLAPQVRQALFVGFLGGFTTFSAFSLDTFLLMEQKRWIVAGLYFIGSPCLALAATFLGVKLGA